MLWSPRDTRALQRRHIPAMTIDAPFDSSPPHAGSRARVGAGRPAFALTDAAAASLARQVEELKAAYADTPLQRRPFIRAFVRAVFHATGHLYGVATYRKLMAAYAPGRKAGSSTIESEKQLLAREIAGDIALVGAHDPLVTPASAPDAAAPDSRPDPLLLDILGLLHHVVAGIGRSGTGAAVAERSPGLQAYNDYLTTRLAATEAELAAARAQAAQLAATAQALQALADERAGQISTLQGAATQQNAALTAMATELQGAQRFMAMQVDGVRGETREVKERCAHLMVQLKDKEAQVEQYRQLAMSRGGAR